MSIFASTYLNEFVTKRCKYVTFADQVLSISYSTKFNKHVKNCSTTRTKTSNVTAG